MEKVKVWQRLFKIQGDSEIYDLLSDTEDDPELWIPDYRMSEMGGLVWLCPRPNPVYVDEIVIQRRRNPFASY